MRKRNKFFISCAVLCAAGLLLSVLGWVFGGRFNGIGYQPGKGLTVFSANSYGNSENGPSVLTDTINDLEAFTSLDIKIDYADISIQPSDHYGVEYQLVAWNPPVIQVKDGQLMVRDGKRNNSSPVMFLSGFNMTFSGSWPSAKEYVTVYVPADTYFTSLYVSTSSGATKISGLQAKELTMVNDYGDVSLSDISCTNMDMKLSSGKFKAENLNGESLKVSNDYGDCSLANSAITAVTALSLSSGKLKISNSSLGRFSADSDYGDVDLNEIFASDASLKLSSGNMTADAFLFSNLTVKSDYGYVDIAPASSESYGYDLKTDYGEIKVADHKLGEVYYTFEKEYENWIRVECSSGDIIIRNKK